MLRGDVMALAPGDSVFGLWNDWDDERRVVDVDPPQKGTDGRVFRYVTVAYGRAHVMATIVSGGPEIRSPALRPQPA
jgi:hypothetical protein